MKKVLSHILVCSLLCYMLVGCNSNTNNNSSETTVSQDTTVSEIAEQTTEETVAQYMATQSDRYNIDYDEESTAPINEQTFYDNSIKFIVTEQYASNNKMISKDGYSIMGGDKDVDALVLPSEYNGRDIVSLYDNAYEGSDIKSLDISDTIEYIGLGSFSYCEKLENVSFGEKIKKIEGLAFYFCSSIKYIEFNESLESVWGSAFSYCNSLRKVTFNGNVKLIGVDSFSSCDSLETVEFKGKYDDLVIGRCAFAYNPNLKSIYLPEGTVEIEAEAFLKCENLEELHIPASVTKFGYNADEENEKEFGKQYVYIESDILRGTDATIYAPKGSAAEQYAKITGREFVAE